MGTFELAATVSSRLRQILGATLLSGALCAGTAALAAPAAPAAPASPQGGDECLLVKNTAARAKCEEARTYVANGQSRSALVSIKQALALSPNEGVMSVVTARIMMRLGSLGPAERELRLARQNGAPDHAVLPTLFGVMIALHKELNLLNEFGEPAKNAQGEVASDILRGRAQALISLGRVPEAIAASDRAISINRTPGHLLVRAGIALSQNDQATADKLVDEAFTLDPNSAGVMRAKLKQLQRHGDTAKTLAFSDQILKVYPKTSPEARIAKIEIFLKRNEDARAKQEADAFAATSRMFSNYYNGVLLSRAKDRKGAANLIMSLPKAFVLAHPEYALQMAQIVIDNGQIDAGAAILSNAISAQSDFIDARLRLAGLRMSQGSTQSALGILLPVQSSGDPRVKKLIGELQGKIAKDRSF